MKLAFIDIDGVMMPFGGKHPYHTYTFAQTAIEAVLRLRDDGYHFVLHSAWRHHESDRAMAYEHFRNAGIELLGHCDEIEPSKSRAISRCLDDRCGPTWPDVLVIDDEPIDLRGVTHIRPASNIGLRLQDLPDNH